MTVTYAEYSKELTKFAQKHNKKGEMKLYTSPMENNRYHKEYCWEDGAQFNEITELVVEQKQVEAHGLKFIVEVEMYRTEYWSTDDATSKYFYTHA